MTLLPRTSHVARPAIVAVAVACLVVAGCGNKKKQEQAARAKAAAAVEGLDALPADVKVVVGANVGKLRDAALVKRAFGQMLARDAGLASRLADLQARCKLDLAKDLESVLVGLAGTTSARDVVLVAKGRFDEAAIAACVQASLADKGGALDKKEQGGMTLYVAKNPGAADVAFAFGAKDVIIVADSEALLLRARDPSVAKLRGDQVMMGYLEQADTRAALWAAGQMAPEVGKGLIAATGGTVKSPAQAIWGHVELGDGLDVELALQMASADDAKALLAVVQKQLGQYALVAQAYAMGAIVNQIKPAARDQVFVVTLRLGPSELAQLVSLLDRGGGQGAATPVDTQDAGSPGTQDAGTSGTETPGTERKEGATP
jgi:hypothetical protein